MEIKNWENYVFKKYNPKKVTNINDFKKYIINYKDIKQEFYCAYKIEDNITFITKVDNTSYRLLTFQKNSNTKTDYSQLPSLNLFLLKTQDIKEYCKKINELYKCKFLLWSNLSLKEKEFYKNKTSFNVENLTESEIDDADFYAAYVFDEDIIAKRKVVSPNNSGWKTTVVFMASKDKQNISNIFVHESNGLTREEMDNFIKDINKI